MQEENVAGATVCLDLSGEDLLEPQVVAGGGEKRCVRGERQSRQGSARATEADRVFGGEVLRVRGGSAVSAEEDPPAALQRGARELPHLPDLSGKDGSGARRQLSQPRQVRSSGGFVHRRQCLFADDRDAQRELSSRARA